MFICSLHMSCSPVIHPSQPPMFICSLFMSCSFVILTFLIPMFICSLPMSCSTVILTFSTPNVHLLFSHVMVNCKSYIPIPMFICSLAMSWSTVNLISQPPMFICPLTMHVLFHCKSPPSPCSYDLYPWHDPLWSSLPYPHSNVHMHVKNLIPAHPPSLPHPTQFLHFHASIPCKLVQVALDCKIWQIFSSHAPRIINFVAQKIPFCRQPSLNWNAPAFVTFIMYIDATYGVTGHMRSLYLLFDDVLINFLVTFNSPLIMKTANDDIWRKVNVILQQGSNWMPNLRRKKKVNFILSFYAGNCLRS